MVKGKHKTPGVRYGVFTPYPVGTARRAVRAAFSGAMVPPASRGGDIAARCSYQSQVKNRETVRLETPASFVAL